MYHPRKSIYTPFPTHQRPFRVLNPNWPFIPKSANVSGRKVSFDLTAAREALARTEQPLKLPEISHELPLYIDSSMLSAWRACQRKHYWSTIRGLYPSGQSVHLVAGAALAAGMEAARRYVFSHPNPKSVPHSKILANCYDAFHTEWGDYVPPDTPRQAKTFVNTWSALENYLETYHPGLDPVQPLRRPDGSPAVEYRFAVPLPILHPCGDPFLFVGRFDLLGVYDYCGQQLLVILDEKTAGSFSWDWADKWDLRGQFLGYIWALRQQGYNISHAVPRGVAIQKTQFDTRSGFVQYTDDLISRWEQQLLRDVQAIKDAYLNLTAREVAGQQTPRDAYNMNFADACDSYGGCAFRTLCTASNPEPFTSNFVGYRWNPLKRNPVEEAEAPITIN